MSKEYGVEQYLGQCKETQFYYQVYVSTEFAGRNSGTNNILP